MFTLSVKHIVRYTIRGFIVKKNLDAKILNYLTEQDWPVTTEMIAKELKVSWNTAQIHLYKLMAEGLVKGRRVRRQNQWIITQERRKKL